MTTQPSRLLVIDASVVCSAGETDNAESSACREVLLSILSICHRAAMTPAIRAEWDRHLSRFSRKWWRSMAAHHKASEHVNPAKINLDMTGYSAMDREVVEKDVNLLETAISADRIIVTRDDKLQDTLAKTSGGKKLEAMITWINPTRQGGMRLRDL